MTIKVNGIEIGNVITNRSMTISEAMYCIGYDITDQDDCRIGYENVIEGFCYEDGYYFFDENAAELDYN